MEIPGKGGDMVSFVKAEPGDASALVRCKVDAFADEIALNGAAPPLYDSVPHTQTAIREAFYFKILDEGRIIGGMSVRPREPGIYRIGSLFVVPGSQNKGIGSQALRFLFDQFPDARAWTLETPGRSLRNHHLYEKAGFAKVGEMIDESNGIRLFVFEKKV